VARLLALAALIGGAACDLGTVTVPSTTAGVVVHGVLNPGAPNQVVLVERTLSGAANLPDTTFDSGDPIVSAGGIPISGATVEIIDPRGIAVRGVEDRTVLPNGKGAGVYRVPIAGASLVMGARYQLHIHTAAGEDVTASTRIPNPEARSSGGLTQMFNRDHDTVTVQWNSVPTARAYALRIESPFGPFFLFTDSTHLRLTGDLRNLFAGNLEHVFIPGFRQDALVAAVDSNFFDYYRTNNDPFTGAGIISRVSGGIGLFGSIVTLNSGTLTVIADRTEPVEGRYRFVPSSSTGLDAVATAMTLYIESPAARAGSPNALSGRYTIVGGQIGGILGEQLGDSVTVTLLNDQLAGNRLNTFIGILRGDTLVGTYRIGGGTVLYVRTP
jgi:hypothetical protein